MKYKSIHSDTQKSLDNLALFVHGFPPLVDKLLASLAISAEINLSFRTHDLFIFRASKYLVKVQVHSFR